MLRSTRILRCDHLKLCQSDMVGHTGVLDAAVKAVQVVDSCLERWWTLFGEGGQLSYRDHRNAEMMLENGSEEPHTAHTTNLVPLILVGERFKEVRARDGGSLEDIAPTMLEILGIPKPPEMTGNSLIEEI